jgi:dihydropteroate synthase
MQIWGILNVTPDSFSDGGRYEDTKRAVARGLALESAGAEVIDIGGESTRPGAREVPAAEETERVVPVVRGLLDAGLRAAISVDTRKSAVAEAALAAGAGIVNDVSAGTHDPELLAVAASHGAGVVLMHMRGVPQTMQDDPTYDDVVDDIRRYLAERSEAAEASGVRADRILVDPGIGFGKTLDHNFEILRRLEAFVADGRPVLLGASRKSFLGHERTVGREAPVDDRLAGSLACAARGVEARVRAVRVHDVQATVDLVRVLKRIRPE